MKNKKQEGNLDHMRYVRLIGHCFFHFDAEDFEAVEKTGIPISPSTVFFLQFLVSLYKNVSQNKTLNTHSCSIPQNIPCKRFVQGVIIDQIV
jgi:hypothetical protein